MTTRTRTVVVGSVVVLILGLGTGFLAYLTGATSAFTAAGPGPDEMRFVPKEATLVAFANVREVMASSELRQGLRGGGLMPGNGPGTLQGETGINPETDIDRVLIGTVPNGADPARSAGVVLARGRFDAVRIERAVRDAGARVEEYRGKRIAVARAASSSTDPLAIAFIEPGLIAFGDEPTVRRAVDAGSGPDSVLANKELVARIQPIEGQSLWAVGRFDALQAQAPFTRGVVGPLPPISWFTASGRIDAGVKAQFAAETPDEPSATGLRDAVRGLMAIGRMQAGARPEFKSLFDSVQIGGSGSTVTLSFDVSPQTLDRLSSGLRSPAGARP